MHPCLGEYSTDCTIVLKKNFLTIGVALFVEFLGVDAFTTFGGNLPITRFEKARILGNIVTFIFLNFKLCALLTDF